MAVSGGRAAADRAAEFGSTMRPVCRKMAASRSHDWSRDRASSSTESHTHLRTHNSSPVPAGLRSSRGDGTVYRRSNLQKTLRTTDLTREAEETPGNLEMLLKRRQRGVLLGSGEMLRPLTLTRRADRRLSSAADRRAPGVARKIGEASLDRHSVGAPREQASAWGRHLSLFFLLERVHSTVPRDTSGGLLLGVEANARR